MYKVILDGLELPLGVPSLTTTVKNRNTEVSLINGEVMSVPRSPGLTTWKFEAYLPNANSERGWLPADEYLTKLQDLKLSKKPFKFQVFRGDLHNPTSAMVTLEDYDRTESSSIGTMSKVSITLKEYRTYQTSYVEIEVPEYVDPGEDEIDTTVVPYSKEIKRLEELNPPSECKANATSRVNPLGFLTPGTGYIHELDSWNDIAKKYLGDEKYGPAIMTLNESQKNDRGAWSPYWTRRFPPSLYPKPHATIKLNVSDIVNTYHKLESES